VHISNDGLPRPSQRQLEFQELELGLFIHYGLPTYTGYGKRGQDSPSEFKPEYVDCDNWMETAKAMGARFAVLTSRHEEGFCLWPTATTEYSVASSPYKEGHGDVVREFIEACKRHDIVPCLYHPSMHDAHHVFQPGDSFDWPDGFFGSTNRRLSDPSALDRFIVMQRQQVRELLTNYGPITYLWLDHMTEKHGILEPTMVTRFWDAIIQESRQWQPECLLLKCEIYLSRDKDAVTGVHGGRAAYPLWHACRREDTWDSLREPVPDPAHGTEYLVWESNTIFSGDWFWNGEQDMKTVDEMVEHYYLTVGRGSTFLPNFAPNPSGRMSEAVMERAREFGDRVRAIYAHSIGAVEDAGGVVELVTNGEPVGHIEIMEDLRDGQKVGAYRVEAFKNGSWATIAEGESVGHRRLHRLPGTVADKVRLTCTRDFAPSPVAAAYVANPVRIRRFAAYS
jgi:alpha-L-fucosidase